MSDEKKVALASFSYEPGDLSPGILLKKNPDYALRLGVEVKRPAIPVLTDYMKGDKQE